MGGFHRAVDRECSKVELSHLVLATLVLQAAALM